MANLYCGISKCICVDENGGCIAFALQEDLNDCKRQTLEENLKNEVPGIKVNEDYSDFNM